MKYSEICRKIDRIESKLIRLKAQEQTPLVSRNILDCLAKLAKLSRERCKRHRILTRVQTW